MFDTSTVAKTDPGSSLDSNWVHKGFLQVYVRGYQDSNGDGIGDLRGLIARLDYIKALGVGGIWLMPINASLDGDHGYAVSDYRGVERDYGTLADVDELLKQAHARGLGVIMDYVINHSATSHPAFEASANANSPYRDWYLWQSPKPTGWNIYGSDPWRSSGNQAYFAAFSTTMPDFNLKNEAVLNWHLDNMRFWLNRGMDGFRFDAVGHLVENGPNAWDNQPENNAILARIQALSNSYTNRYIVCEGPGAPWMYAMSSSCNSAFAFRHNGNLLAAAKGDGYALQEVTQFPVPGAGKSPQRMATLLSNHDAFAGVRVWDQLAGNEGAYKVAAAMMLLQPGIPFVYYGEEIGLAGAANLSGDWQLRTPMSWTANSTHAGFSTVVPFRSLSANASTHNVAAQEANANGILAHYKALLGLRGSRASVARGSYERASTSGSVLSFVRSFGTESTGAAINTASTAMPFTLRGLKPNQRLTLLYASTASSNASGAATSGMDFQADSSGDANITLPAHAVWVWAH